MLRLFFIFFFLPSALISQVSDDFSDGDFTQIPAWAGDNSQFVVNSSQQLQLNSVGTDTSYLSIASTSIDSVEWSFWVKLTFAPSDNNYAKIYLVSDQTNLKAPLNGYFIRLGENGSFDSVDLWRQNGTSETKLIDGINGHCAKTSNTLRIKIIRDKLGNWQLFSDTLGGINYSLEGNIGDASFTTTTTFGVSCKYTTTNSSRFYFDDFYVGPVRIDTVAPQVISVFAKSTTQVDVYFNESVDLTSAQTSANYSVSDGVGNPATAMRDAINSSLVHLAFTTPFQGSKTYTLSIAGVSDQAANTITSTSAFFVLAENVVANDIVINEILADPNTGGVDFVEAYNRSTKVIDLKQLSLCSFDTVTNQLSSITTIATSRTLLYPQQYVVFTSNATAVKSQYYTSNPNGFIELASIPSMNIASGIVVFADTAKNIIDRFDYNEKMHFALLNNTKGVSLERLDADRPANDKNNWHSAAASVGFATPAYKNSQAIDSKSGTEVTISPEVFSPDNDGTNDVLNIHYAFDAPGFVATVSVYNSNGILARTLTSNELLGSAGNITWDGISDSRELSSIGMYIIYFQVFNSFGTTKNFKKVAVLSHAN